MNKYYEKASVEMPLVCVCIPTYNSEGTIRETLESILNQTYSNLVVHISDNASTDSTIKIVNSIVDQRIHIHQNDVNVGGEGNFTRCIKLSTGKYTVIFHADDIYECDMVAKQVDFLEKTPEVSAVFTEALTFDSKGSKSNVIGRPPGDAKKVTRFNFVELLKSTLLHSNFLVCPSVMVRSEIYIEKIQEWGDRSFRSSSDVDMWFQLAKIKPIAVIGEQLMRYRISSNQFSEKIRNRTERADFFLVLDHYLAQPEVCRFLSSQDLRHYEWLDRHDRVARSLNLFVQGRFAEVHGLLTNLICMDSIYAATVSRRGLVTLASGLLLRFLLLVGATRIGIKIIFSIKKIRWKF